MSGQLVLFYNNYSICSIMVRFTLAICKALPGEQINIDEKPIDIHNGGQLTEYYLTEVNPYGTVPVLMADKHTQPTLTESLDITVFLGQVFPSLYPTHLDGEIKGLLKELHEITYFSLTYTKSPQRASDMENSVKALLSDTSISDHYRKALEFKLNVVRKTRAPALSKEFVAEEEKKATDFLSKISNALKTHKGNASPWIFATQNATALDAHVVPFLCRLLDVGRWSMLDGTVQSYAKRVFELPVWKDFMAGKTTVYKAYA